MHEQIEKEHGARGCRHLVTLQMLLRSLLKDPGIVNRRTRGLFACWPDAAYSALLHAAAKVRQSFTVRSAARGTC